MAYDVIIRGGRWFDGTGAPSAVRDIGVRDGRVVAISATPLDATDCPEVLDAAGKWVTPGFVDVHTHYDAEVLGAPGLGESIRHGVTTVMVGSCSLGTVHAEPEDAADMFARVEAVPHQFVLSALREKKTWSSAGEYATALEGLALGPNVTSLLGHSDARAAVMGLGRSTETETVPTDGEMRRMEAMLEEALDAGFVGLSEQRNPWDRLGGDRYRSRTLPSTYAKWKEYRRLHKILRRRGKVLQSIPNLTKPQTIAPYLFASMGYGVRNPLKTSFLTAADVKSTPAGWHLFVPVARLTNKIGRGDFRWQHVPAPFTVFADGIDLVVFEEFGAGSAALHLKDLAAREEFMRSKEYRARFRTDLENKWAIRVWSRRLDDVHILDCPDRSTVGKTVAEVAEGRETDAIDTFLDLLIEHGPALRWTTVISNHRPRQLDKLSAAPEVQIGFADSGAHLRNMAFYNIGLHLLYRTQLTGFMTPERAVHRLTGELADWFGIDAGRLHIGDRADIVVIDPAGLDASVTEHHEAPVDCFDGLRRLVNRNDRAVSAVYVAGNRLYGDGTFTPTFGTRRSGRFLRAGETRGKVDPATVHSPATPTPT